MSNNEEWREIPEFPMFMASNTGKVKTRFSPNGGLMAPGLWRELWITPNKQSGRHQFSIKNEDLTRNMFRYHAVLLAFVGPCPEGLEARHLDGNAGNDCLDNLCWGTRNENARDKFRHNTVLRGERIASSRLTPEKVLAICRMLASGKTQKEAAKEFGISDASISMFVTGQTWKHISKEIKEALGDWNNLSARHRQYEVIREEIRQKKLTRKPRAKLSSDDAEEIRKRYAAGEKQKTLAEEFDVTQASISNIINGRRWTATLSEEEVEKIRTPRAKTILTTEQIIEIRRRVEAGENQREIGEEYGISQASVSRVASRATFAGIE